MKPIKLTTENIPKIQAVLDGVNGKAVAHTITSAIFVQSEAMALEKQLIALLGGKKWLPGAVAKVLSGGQVSGTYEYSREGTGIHFLWTRTGVVVAEIYRTSIGGKGGCTTLILTPEQDGQAIQMLRRKYTFIGGANYWLGPTGGVTSWGVFAEEDAARAAFALVSR